jgi:dTDP-4-amino-4,6-dideoxygalactose transaminase
MSAESLLEKECGGKVFLTPSCTAALELACMMILEPGDEVIMPSWAFPSCANAVILRGGVPVFVDVDENLNLDPIKVGPAISSKTKAVITIHYAGVVGRVEELSALCDRYGLYLIEDAAQAIGNWKVIGDFGCLSFHYTKNISCDQGGALIVNNEQFIEKTKMMMHCGTNKGTVKNYSWLTIGSQYIMSRFQIRALESELNSLDKITANRRNIWNIYKEKCPAIELAVESGNGHFFWWMQHEKWKLVDGDITSHFEALHNTIPGRKYGRTGGFCSRSLRAQDMLLKLNTGVTEAKALKNCEALWPH